MTKKTKDNTEEPLEKKLWKAADKLRKNMDAAEYKHVVLGLIFLKFISDAFEELYNKPKEGLDFGYAAKSFLRNEIRNLDNLNSSHCQVKAFPGIGLNCSVHEVSYCVKTKGGCV